MMPLLPYSSSVKRKYKTLNSKWKMKKETDNVECEMANSQC